ncbi:MAG TPA: hypothetical protein VNN55_08815 [bacterium]|nr:hypothetical protein [bacterium]
MLAFLLIVAKWLGLAGMSAAAIIGYAAPRLFTWETHYLMGMVSTFLYALAQVMITYYFIGMRTAMVRAAAKYELGEDYAVEAQAIKRRVTRLGHWLPLLATATLIVAGGVLFGQMTPWLHWALGGLTILLGVTSGATEWRAFKQNAALFERAAARIRALPEQTPDATAV